MIKGFNYEIMPVDKSGNHLISSNPIASPYLVSTNITSTVPVQEGNTLNLEYGLARFGGEDSIKIKEVEVVGVTFRERTIRKRRLFGFKEETAYVPVLKVKRLDDNW